jgi:hypothetical protein
MYKDPTNRFLYAWYEAWFYENQANLKMEAMEQANQGKRVSEVFVSLGEDDKEETVYPTKLTTLQENLGKDLGLYTEVSVTYIKQEKRTRQVRRGRPFYLVEEVDMPFIKIVMKW